MAKASSGPGRRARPAAKNQSNQSNRANPSTPSNRANPPQRAAAGRTTPLQASRVARLRKERPMLGALVPVALIVVALVALVVIKATGGSSSPAAASKMAAGSGSTVSNAGTAPLASGVLTDVSSVSSATRSAIGEPSGTVNPASTGAKTTLTASNGKPEILFIGAEFCPYCAAERWSVVEALSRFGTFSGLTATHSSSSDIYPDTKTFSFYGATYSSTNLDFTSVELETNQPSGSSYTSLQTPTAAQTALLSKYDKAPYTSQPGSIPFLDIANKYVSVGAGYSPQVLQGLSMQQIAAQLNNPKSTVAIAVDGEANRIVAAITAATGVRPDTTTTTATSTTSTTTTAVGS
jgi:hypothetical protein